MPRFRSTLFAATAAALLAACTVGAVFETDPSDMLSLAPPGVPVKVVTVEATCQRGRLVVDEPTMARIGQMPGVYAVRRGGGRNVVNVLVDEMTRPESIAERLEPDCYGRVLGVVTAPKE